MRYVLLLLWLMGQAAGLSFAGVPETFAIEAGDRTPEEHPAYDHHAGLDPAAAVRSPLAELTVPVPERRAASESAALAAAADGPRHVPPVFACGRSGETAAAVAARPRYALHCAYLC